MAQHIPSDIYQPHTEDNKASPVSILILTENNTEDLEFFYPYYRFIEEGFNVEVATLNGGEFAGKHGIGLKQTRRIEDLSPDDYDLLYIPGGKAPEKLKKSEEVLAFTRQFFDTGKPIAALCHGPQVLAAADIISGRSIAAWPQVEKEVADAGAIYVSRETVIDGPFITGRWPADLPIFTSCVLNEIHDKRAMAERNILAPATSRFQ